MGIEFFKQQCDAQATETSALIWCVTKEGTCCGICSDTLASIGTRVGLSVAVFFATLVIVVDGAETPFVFLTTLLQALAYLLVVFWEGRWGGGISRFHSYYALFCSFGWLCPMAAASLTATHYGYGGNHQKTGVRLFAYRTDFKRPPSRPARGRRSIDAVKEENLADLIPSSSHPDATHRRTTLPPEAEPLVNDDATTSDYSPLSQPMRARPSIIPIMERPRPRIGSSRRSRTRENAEESTTPEMRQTPSSLLGLPLRHDDRVLNHKKSDYDIGPLHRANTIDSEVSIRQRRRPPSSRPQSVQSSPQADLPEATQSNRRSIDTVYTPEQLRKITRKVDKGKWSRRRSYPISVFVLWLIWLLAFFFVHETIPTFTLSQTDCPDPEGTELLKHSSITFLALGPLVIVAFVLNYHTQWLPRQLRKILDFNRDSSFWTRFLLPALFSGAIFTLWQALLWEGYHLASQPDSSLLASTEKSATFATVLSLALTIKPVTDLVKALAKIRKRTQRERDEAAKHSGFTPGQTPSALPPLRELRLPEIPDFTPLEPPAIRVSHASSTRRYDSTMDPNPTVLNRSRSRSHTSIHRQSPSPPDSTPSSQRSSIADDQDDDIRPGGRRLGRGLGSWRERLSSSAHR
ncbi:hypothetical protein JCM5353_007112 [Sporobolomyces roseus]